MQSNATAYTTRLDSLRPKYLAALAERRQTALAYLSDGGDAATLRSEAHKTAGTAGSFGYDKLTMDADRLCRALDGDADVTARCQAYLESIESVLSL